MDSQHSSFAGHQYSRAAIAVAIVVALTPAAAFAQAAGEVLQAQPGDIVLTRNVPTRIAYRQPVSPGLALVVSPMPNQQLDNALGLSTGEVSDADAANLGASAPSGNTTAVGQALNNALGNNLGTRTGSSSGTVPGNAIGGSMGAIGNATSGIGGQVTGALSQIPMATVPVGTGH
ncbi:MAG: hypothetical protein WA777_05060 [Rhodanobacter sp.]